MSPPRSRLTRYVTRRRSITAAVGVGALVAAGLAATGTSHAATTDADALQTIRADKDTYHIYVDGERRAAVDVSDPAYTVRATLSPDREKVAVISDFDGRFGARLSVLDVFSGQLKPVAKQRISSAAFNADGVLAYLRASEQSSTVHTVRPDRGKASRVGRITGGEAAVLGWTADGDKLLIRRSTTTGASVTPESLVSFSPKRGESTTVLASDPDTQRVYRDFRLVTVDGKQRISFIESTTTTPCAGADQRNTVGLATETGTVVERLGRTQHTYRSAVWSDDGAKVAYELQACVTADEKATNRTAAIKRVEKVNGVYVLDRASGEDHRLVRGISQHHRLTGFSDGKVRLGSERVGVQALAADAKAVSADSLVPKRLRSDGSGDVEAQDKIMNSVFIHQLWDTADDFHGGSACGPTSAVMDLASYQLANEFPVDASSPYPHTSPYGGYISKVYDFAGVTYNVSAPDPAGNPAHGAYGWMVTDPSVGTVYVDMSSFLNQHVDYPVAEDWAGNISPQWIRDRIDANLMVVISGDFGYGQWGHISLITGYTDDGLFYVNDPYGAGTDQSYDGHNTLYDLSYMSPKYYWAA